MEGQKFFKIIFDPLAHRLRIPGEFITKRYGRNLPNIVFLKVPSGLVWRVELLRSDGETWLQKGWREFKEFHSLGFGHVLVFEYDGDSYFHVLIFDVTASEIEYPLERNDTYREVKFNKVPKLMNNGSESDGPVVFVEDFSVDSRGKGKQIVEVNEEDDDVSVEILDNATAKYQEKIKISVRAMPTKKHRGIGRKSQQRLAIDKKTCLAYQTAKAFMSKNQTQNPFYISIMHPSYVSSYVSNLCLPLPLNFAEENLPNKRNFLTLRVSKGRKWRVGCNIGLYNAKIYQGWKVFLQDNGIKIGDVCVFEVVKISPKPEWNVIIFRG